MPDANGWVHYTESLPKANTHIQYWVTDLFGRKGVIKKGFVLNGGRIQYGNGFTFNLGPRTGSPPMKREWWRERNPKNNFGPNEAHPTSHDVTPEQPKEGESMFDAYASKTVGGFKAQVRNRESGDVLWESSTVYTNEAKEDGSPGPTGEKKAMDAAQKVINDTAAALFSKVKE